MLRPFNSWLPPSPVYWLLTRRNLGTHQAINHRIRVVNPRQLSPTMSWTKPSVYVNQYTARFCTGFAQIKCRGSRGETECEKRTNINKVQTLPQNLWNSPHIFWNDILTTSFWSLFVSSKPRYSERITGPCRPFFTILISDGVSSAHRFVMNLIIDHIQPDLLLFQSAYMNRPSPPSAMSPSENRELLSSDSSDGTQSSTRNGGSAIGFALLTWATNHQMH